MFNVFSGTLKLVFSKLYIGKILVRWIRVFPSLLSC